MGTKFAFPNMKRHARAGFVALSLSLLLPAVWWPQQDQVFVSQGVPLRFVEAGAGDPVVLIHGYTRSLDDWTHSGVFQTLGREYHVIALDCRGHGRSGKPHEPGAYGVELGQDVLRLMDHLGIRRAHVVGFSLGGSIVARLLVEHPDRFLSATLAAGWGRRPGGDAQAESLATEISQGSLRSLLLRQVPPSEPPPTEDALRTRSTELLAGQDLLALAAVMRSTQALEVTEAQLAGVTVPTLAIVGSSDRGVAGGTRLKAVMPTLQLVVVDGATHASLVGRPEFVETLRSFLAAHRQR